MYKRSIAVCLILALMILPSGCERKKETAELPVLDEATRIYIEGDWMRFRYTKDIVTEFPRWYSELTRSGLDGVRYYGRHGYYDVWYAPTAVGTPMTRDICGIRFSSGNEFAIYASCIENDDLGLGYENGLLSWEDLEEIAAVHQAYEERIAAIKATWDTEAEPEQSGEVELPVASGDLKQELERAYKGAFGIEIFWDSVDHGGYYGTYNGCSVFYQLSLLTIAGPSIICGVPFCNSPNFDLYAHRDGQWKSIQEAYDFYWLTKADLIQIARIHAEADRLRFPEFHFEEENSLQSND